MVIAECANEMDAKLVVPMTQTSNNYIWLYLGLTILMIALNYVGNVAFASFTLSVAKGLHNKMVASLLHAQMQFFDTTPQGRITNRFSKDTNSVDQGIQRFALQSLHTGLTIFGMMISMAVVNWPCTIIIIPCVIIFISLFMVFRLVYPQIKRLETVTRSPVFNIVQETLDCLVTIRAYGVQEQ